MYSTQKLSSYQIASVLRVSQSFVMNKLKEYGIKRRTIQQGKALTAPRYKRKNFSDDPVQKAYFIGFRIGDLYVTQTHPASPTIRISTNTTKEEQIKLVSRLFSPYGHVRCAPSDKRGAQSIRCFVNTSFAFLLKKWDGIEDWILQNNEYFLAFFAGYTDAEGSFCICNGNGVFSIQSQEKNILRLIVLRLNKMGILCMPPTRARIKGSVDKRGIGNNKDVWRFTIYRKDALLRLIALFKSRIRHHDRKNAMYKVESNIKMRNQKYHNKQDQRWYKNYSIHERAFKMEPNQT